MTPKPSDRDSFHPGKSVIPAHVGFIGDGMRRWARLKGHSLDAAFEPAMEKLDSFLRYFYDRGTAAVSVYFSATQNFRRPRGEVRAFNAAEYAFCTSRLPAIIEKYKTRVSVAGRMELLPADLRDALKHLVNSTRRNKRTRLYLLAAYNPIDEVEAAVRAVKRGERFTKRLWVPEPLDLVIRTSGVCLLSNFLPLQAGFARIYVIDKLLNDVHLSDIAQVYRHFGAIQRKYGE